MAKILCLGDKIGYMPYSEFKTHLLSCPRCQTHIDEGFDSYLRGEFKNVTLRPGITDKDLFVTAWHLTKMRESETDQAFYTNLQREISSNHGITLLLGVLRQFYELLANNKHSYDNAQFREWAFDTFCYDLEGLYHIMGSDAFQYIFSFNHPESDPKAAQKMILAFAKLFDVRPEATLGNIEHTQFWK